jgi:hypothetical protein
MKHAKINEEDTVAFTCPLLATPLVLNQKNIPLFEQLGINIILPNDGLYDNRDHFLLRTPLELIENYSEPLDQSIKICIDWKNGASRILHSTILEMKEIHGNNMILMAGNVGSQEAFLELAKTGVDYIRVGLDSFITRNVGVGENLEGLVWNCAKQVKWYKEQYAMTEEEGFEDYYRRQGFSKNMDLALEHYENSKKISKVKIVADNITEYVKYCKKYGFAKNGYAAINKLIDCGADLVIPDKIFLQCLESDGERRVKEEGDYYTIAELKDWLGEFTELEDHFGDGLCVESKGLSEKEYITAKWTIRDWMLGSQENKLFGFRNSYLKYLNYTGK